eukprot:scaffold101321_cov40-Prasinocladus_malaysianus.AAC.2
MWPVSDALSGGGSFFRPSGLKILYALIVSLVFMNAAEIWFAASVAEPCTFFQALTGPASHRGQLGGRGVAQFLPGDVHRREGDESARRPPAAADDGDARDVAALGHPLPGRSQQAAGGRRASRHCWVILWDGRVRCYTQAMPGGPRNAGLSVPHMAEDAGAGVLEPGVDACAGHLGASLPHVVGGN